MTPGKLSNPQGGPLWLVALLFQPGWPTGGVKRAIGAKSMYYKLNPDHTTEPCGHEEFIALYSEPTRTSRRIEKTDLPNGGWVSTIFLGFDPSLEEGPPLLFETMYFPQRDDIQGDLERYSTWDEAVAGHQRMVEKYQ